MTQLAAPKRQHSCLFFGCIGGAVCLLVILVLFLLGLHLFRKALNQYTDTAPMKLPPLELSQPEVQALQRRFSNFSDAVSSGRPTPPLELSADEINGLIANQSDFPGAADKIRVSIRDEHLEAQMSLPLSEIGWSMFKGRYLNGTGTFALKLEDGILHIKAVEISVKGKPLPNVYMEKLRGEDLATGINNNSRASVALNRLQGIEIKDGKLVLVPKMEK